ncbi:hypothetical protein RRG08_060090 [Elysia crispata]|uniref:Uncharacterized protein n=1 Tax=Elysia crispata TaxID=231223 RepID=A0AAE1AEG8_9GAST|nr:hypothetical protein RRG08_060090 [Elysia crispata]
MDSLARRLTNYLARSQTTGLAENVEAVSTCLRGNDSYSTRCDRSLKQHGYRQYEVRQITKATWISSVRGATDH